MRKLIKSILPEVGVGNLKIRSRGDNRCESAKDWFPILNMKHLSNPGVATTAYPMSIRATVILHHQCLVLSIKFHSQISNLMPRESSSSPE